ncbi:MAG: SpoIIE family protein phosphatase [Chloroflexi bacterium]|nr:SpoIIE family protein phosphatase [Chloroflexota bacterium]
MQIAIVKRSFPNDPHCGDECAYWQSDEKITLCIVDGLGHGWDAEKAAKAAVDYVAKHISEPLPDIFAGCDRAIRHTRGGVMGIAVVDENVGTLTYAGIGNPRIIIARAHHRAASLTEVSRLSNRPGVVGGGCGRVLPETISLRSGDVVILFTDGVPSELDLRGYESALHTDVQQLAQRIVQDWGRERDDVAVLVFRYGGA